MTGSLDANIDAITGSMDINVDVITGSSNINVEAITIFETQDKHEWKFETKYMYD